MKTRGLANDSRYKTCCAQRCCSYTTDECSNVVDARYSVFEETIVFQTCQHRVTTHSRGRANTDRTSLRTRALDPLLQATTQTVDLLERHFHVIIRANITIKYSSVNGFPRFWGMVKGHPCNRYQALFSRFRFRSSVS